LHVWAAPDAVAEIVHVLLDNATRHGGPHVEITATVDRPFVRIVVHDDGAGVEPALRSRVFDWGERGPHSRGMGIGLHIAHELAVRQGGYLRLEPRPDGGATFALGLPLGPAGPPARPVDDPEYQRAG
jgi:signal transduction histidine kinase